MKTTIVCEGGGMRGVFTAGVLQALMDAGFVADALVGVSAGASNGASYVSGQSGRGYRTNVNYAGDKRYGSWWSYLKTRSYFGMDYVFGEIPEKLDPFDYDAFYASPCGYYVGATDVETGKVVYFEKPDVKPGLMVIRASCSMPVFSPMVEIDGRKYLDGGVTDPIPIGKAQELGNERMLVILTRNRGYFKKPARMRPVMNALFRHYPNFAQAMQKRHEVYNQTLEKLWSMEAAGQAIVAAPPEPLGVDRLGKDKGELVAAFHIGQCVGKATLKKLV